MTKQVTIVVTGALRVSMLGLLSTIVTTVLSTSFRIVFCLTLYTEEINFANFCHDLMQNHSS